MKKVKLMFLALTILPGIALADSVKTTTETRYGPAAIETPAAEKADFSGTIERITTIITRTETKNARSETEYLANRPNPGTKITDVEVWEEVKLR